MDTNSVNNPLCIICCRSINDGDPFPDILEHQDFKLFCTQLEAASFACGGFRDTKWFTKDLFKCLETASLARNGLSACFQCQKGITGAVAMRTEAEMIEAEVLSLQLQLVETLKELKRKMDRYFERVRWVGEVIKGSDGGRLVAVDENEDSGKRKQTRRKKKQKTSGVAAFRNAIVNVASELKAYNEELSKRFSCDQGQVEVNPESSERASSQSKPKKRGRKPKKVEPSMATVLTTNEVDNQDFVEEPEIKMEVDMDSIPEHFEDDFQNDDNVNDVDDNLDFGLDPETGKVGGGDGDDELDSPLESEVDDNSDQDYEPEPYHKKKEVSIALKKERASSSKSLLPSSNEIPELEDLDLTQFPKFRRRLIGRMLRRGKGPRNPQTESEFSQHKQDLLQKYPAEYDKDSGNLIIGGVSIAIHDDLKMMSCSLCDYHSEPQGTTSKKDFYMDMAMWNHIVGKHLDGFQCPLCGKPLTSLPHLRRHLKDHKADSLDCEVCGKPLSSLKGLSQHKWTHFSKEEKLELERQGIKKPKNEKLKSHICPTCGKTFSTANTLQNHQFTHLPEEERNKLRVVCPDCGKSMFQSSYLIYHQKYACPANDNKPKGIPCEVCGAVLKTSFQKKKHFEYAHGPNSNLRPFSCDLCEKTFKTKTNLKLHLKNHMAEKEFHCSKGCGRSFKQKRNCVRHEKTCHHVQFQYHVGVPVPKYDPFL